MEPEGTIFNGTFVLLNFSSIIVSITISIDRVYRLIYLLVLPYLILSYLALDLPICPSILRSIDVSIDPI